MEIKDAKYIVTAVKPEQYPVHFWPEVALVGRSNVGKSSFINALVNRKGLARESATPGKTREINFYSVNNKLYLVDLPGYGYAKVSKAEKIGWAEMIETYLITREQLQLILLLIDIRHEPSADDKTMLNWLRNQARPYLVIANKLDKLSKNQIHKQLMLVRSSLVLTDNEPVIPFSAATKDGRAEVWEFIRKQIDC